MEAKRRTGRKILMFPWLAFGHISPFLELAKKISQNSNFQMFLCSSPVNLQSIHTKLPQSFSSSIELVELHLPSLPELPPHMHTTNGLPLHLIPTLLNASEMAASDFSSILHKLDPDLLITDMLHPWAIPLASSLNIPVVTFLVVGAGSFCHPVHGIINQIIPFPFPELDLRDHWFIRLYLSTRKASSSENDLKLLRQWLQNQKLCSNLLLVNSIREIEAKYLDYLSDLLKKKVFPVGPLIEEAVISAADEKSDILDWLDKKQPKSTVYVSFGSEYYLSKEDREELAHGLELSGANFIWVIRFPKGEKIGMEEALPDGFIERVGERGVVVDGWAPQLKILKHSSIGGFVCHCGWNSVMEATAIGVPIIALPMQLDQPYHARVAVEAGASIEAERGVVGAIQREGVAKAIKQVMFEKTGENLSQKAKEISETLKVRKGRNIEDLMAELRQICLDGEQ